MDKGSDKVLTRAQRETVKAWAHPLGQAHVIVSEEVGPEQFKYPIMERWAKQTQQKSPLIFFILPCAFYNEPVSKLSPIPLIQYSGTDNLDL